MCAEGRVSVAVHRTWRPRRHCARHPRGRLAQSLSLIEEDKGAGVRPSSDDNHHTPVSLRGTASISDTPWQLPPLPVWHHRSGAAGPAGGRPRTGLQLVTPPLTKAGRAALTRAHRALLSGSIFNSGLLRPKCQGEPASLPFTQSTVNTGVLKGNLPLKSCSQT